MKQGQHFEQNQDSLEVSIRLSLTTKLAEEIVSRERPGMFRVHDAVTI